MEDKIKRDLKGRFIKGEVNEWTFVKGIIKPHQSNGIRGPEHYNWKGGRIIIKTGKNAGYVYIHKPQHPKSNFRGYVFEHRLIMEEYLDRYLQDNEIVHHINGNKSDNRLENLELTNPAKHCAFHKPAKKS